MLNKKISYINNLSKLLQETRKRRVKQIQNKHTEEKIKIKAEIIEIIFLMEEIKQKTRYLKKSIKCIKPLPKKAY